jgi:hypothetical protein
MQSTGHGGRHSPQPVQSSASTACSRRGAPAIASTGQAWIHSVQPMQRTGSIRTVRRGRSVPQLGSSATAGRPVSSASRAMVARPPGGQRLIGAPSRAMAAA